MTRLRPTNHNRAFGAPLGALILLAMAAACSRPAETASPPAAQSAPAAPAPAPHASGPVELLIPEDARTRAGVELGLPVRRAVTSRLRLPGSVAPDAYGQVTILALVAGRVTIVSAQLGTAVSEGQPVATILSSDFADAQATYLTHQAAVNADHERVMRLERLVTIGAASRQDLDDARAMHTNHTSELGRALARLTLFGFTAQDVDRLASSGAVTNEYVARAPGAGVITKRDVNPGQIVSADAPIAQVSRLDRVWVLASAFEQDLGRLQIGMPAAISARGRADAPLASRVAYVDPQVNLTTRAGEVRFEIVNANRRFKFGELVDVAIDLPGAPDAAGGLAVPSEAVQSVGDATVVYVQDPQRAGILREVNVTVVGSENGWSDIRGGLAATDRIVIRGAVFVRAERLRTMPLGSGR